MTTVAISFWPLPTFRDHEVLVQIMPRVSTDMWGHFVVLEIRTFVLIFWEERLPKDATVHVPNNPTERFCQRSPQRTVNVLLLNIWQIRKIPCINLSLRPTHNGFQNSQFLHVKGSLLGGWVHEAFVLLILTSKLWFHLLLQATVRLSLSPKGKV